MNFTVDLEYTPYSPQDGLPFTEKTFCRCSVPFTFDVKEVGIVLVDFWNFGWDDGSFDEELADIKLVTPKELRPWSFGTGPAVQDWLQGQC